MTRATVEDSTTGLGQTLPYVKSSERWVILPVRLGAVHDFTGTVVARSNPGSGHEMAADAGVVCCSGGLPHLPVIRTPWVALSVVSSVDRALSTAQQHNETKVNGNGGVAKTKLESTTRSLEHTLPCQNTATAHQEQDSWPRKYIQSELRSRLWIFLFHPS